MLLAELTSRWSHAAGGRHGERQYRNRSTQVQQAACVFAGLAIFGPTFWTTTCHNLDGDQMTQAGLDTPSDLSICDSVSH